MKQYYTQMEAAKKDIITPEMEIVAAKEDMDVEQLRDRVAQGVIAIPCNVRHTSISPEGIGMGLRTKINVNLGISGDCKDYSVEMQKVDMAIKFGAEAIMDLSPPAAYREIAGNDRHRTDVRRDWLSRERPARYHRGGFSESGARSCRGRR